MFRVVQIRSLLSANFSQVFGIGVYSNVRYLWAGITDRLRLEWISGGNLVQPSAQAWPPTAGCPGPSPDSFLISLMIETKAFLDNLC